MWQQRSPGCLLGWIEGLGKRFDQRGASSLQRRCFMKLHYFFGGILAAALLAVWPENGLAHGGGSHGGGAGGGGDAFAGGGGHGFRGGHAFSGFTGRGFSPGFSGTRGFSNGRFSGHGDHRRFGDHGFRGRDHDLRDRRFRDFDGDSFDFGSTGFGYPDYSYYYPYSYHNNNGYLSVERAVQEELAELGYYYGPVDGAIGPETVIAIRWFQSVAKIPVTGRIDSATLRALQIS
jgi:hypothetical protein